MHDLLFSIGEWLEGSPLASALASYPHIIPMISAIHYFSVFLTVGTIVALNLRVLGVAGHRQPVTQVAEDLSPWIWTGFITAVLTGLLITVPGAGELFIANFFFTKMLVVLLGFVSVLVVQRTVRQGDPSATRVKVAALISLLLWVCSLLAGTQLGQFACG